MTPNPKTATNKAAKNQSSQPQPPEGLSEQTNLSYRYGTIGIEAVAAAVRYAGAGTNPVDAPVVERTEDRFVETAV